MADDKLQTAADLAEKYGDTKTQANVKTMQNPKAHSDEGYWKGTSEPLLWSKKDREQYERTDDKSKENDKKKSSKSGMDSYKKGGKVKKTGPAYLHKGEKVLTTKQVKKLGSKKTSARKRA